MTVFPTFSHSIRLFHRRICLGDSFFIRIAGFFIALLPLAPWQVQAQCQPGQVKPSSAGATSGPPQFYDEPQFSVAGVADTTNLGGHGSDTVVRTKEALAKDTALLRKQTTGPAADPASGATGQAPGAASDYDKAYALAMADASAGKYEESRLKLRALLANADTAELHHALGDTEEKLKRPLEAVREYQRAAEMNPTEPYLFDWGTELLAHRAPEAAIEVFAKGNRLFPNSVRMLAGLGVALHAHGSYEQAAACLCQASDLDPSDPTAYTFLGKMLNAGTIQSQDVVDKLARFARLHPENALAYYYYANALWKSANGSRAEPDTAARVQELLEKAVQLDPKLGSAYLQRGIVYSALGDLTHATSAYQQAIAASPELEEAHYRLSQLYRRAGERGKAQRELQLYEQLSKSATERAERERRDVQQFVVALRDVKPATSQPQKP